MKIGVIVAMDKEFTQLKTLLDDSRTERKNKKDFVIGEIGNNQIFMQQCGIGKVNSAIGAVEMINNYHPDLIVSTGVAGGVQTEMNPLDVIIGTRYYYHDVYCGDEVNYGQFVGMPPYFSTNKELVKKAIESVENSDLFHQGNSKVYSGPIVSGDWFVNTKEKMQSILEIFPKAMAVDMESCSIAQTCYIYRVAFISFRIISDVPLKDQNASQYFDFWNRLAEGSFNATKSFLTNIDYQL